MKAEVIGITELIWAHLSETECYYLTITTTTTQRLTIRMETAGSSNIII